MQNLMDELAGELEELDSGIAEFNAMCALSEFDYYEYMKYLSECEMERANSIDLFNEK